VHPFGSHCTDISRFTVNKILSIKTPCLCMCRMTRMHKSWAPGRPGDYILNAASSV